jgi:hypothetical protein
MFMTNDWIEFTESGYQERRNSPRVMLSKDKIFRVNPQAMELLGRPTAVKFFFDVARNRIGIKGESDQAKNSFPIRRRGTDSSAYVHGALFCNRFGIKPESTMAFDGVRLDGSGILILELSTATRPIGRASSV